MKENCYFEMNPAFDVGIRANFLGILLYHLVRPASGLNHLFHRLRTFNLRLLAHL